MLNLTAFFIGYRIKTNQIPTCNEQVIFYFADNSINSFKSKKASDNSASNFSV